MGRKGASEMEKYLKQLQKLEKDMPQIMTELAAHEGEVIAGLVKERTPVDTGLLREATHSYTSPLLNTAKSATVWVVNNTEYASLVEKGHSQEPGRFVPALGKQLKRKWVNGRFMMRTGVRVYKQDVMVESVDDFVVKKIRLKKYLGHYI